MLVSAGRPSIRLPLKKFPLKIEGVDVGSVEGAVAGVELVAADEVVRAVRVGGLGVVGLGLPVLAVVV